MPNRTAALCGAIRESSHPLTGSPADYDSLLDAIAAEADWPDTWRLNQYVRGVDASEETTQAQDGFRRFPQWMWRNAEVVEFARWLCDYNDGRPAERRSGFYGLDLYGLRASITAVLSYLEKVDQQSARLARYRYSCFEDFGEDPQSYGFAASFDLSKSCQSEAVGQLLEMQRRAAELAQRDGAHPAEAYFFAEQNARVVRNAEEYYRNMFGNRVSSWNLRDRHMSETLDHLVRYLEKQYGYAKVVVWAHNSHLGDARATEMAPEGEINLDQLVRERYSERAFLVGFTTYAGSVTAAHAWDGEVRRECARNWRTGAWGAPSESSTGRLPSASATTSTRTCLASSTPSCTLTRRALWSPSNAPRNGRKPRNLRCFHRASETCSRFASRCVIRQ